MVILLLVEIRVFLLICSVFFATLVLKWKDFTLHKFANWAGLNNSAERIEEAATWCCNLYELRIRGFCEEFVYVKVAYSIVQVLVVLVNLDSRTYFKLKLSWDSN